MYDKSCAAIGASGENAGLHNPFFSQPKPPRIEWAVSSITSQGIFVAAAPQPEDPMQSRAADGDAERIRALNAGWAAAAARRDLDGMMAIYAHEPRS